MLGDNRYRLQSMYAESADDNLLFQSTENGLQLLDTEFSRTLPDEVVGYLQRFHSIPAFLSTLTLELFSRQTMVG
jgi:mitotic spindle assembly checkpoint protein MAD1